MSNYSIDPDGYLLLHLTDGNRLKIKNIPYSDGEKWIDWLNEEDYDFEEMDPEEVSSMIILNRSKIIAIEWVAEGYKGSKISK